MRTYTFDTNCLIDLIEKRPSACYISDLIEAHRRGDISVAFVAVSASERQQGDYYLPTYIDFTNRLHSAEVADIPHIKGMAYFDISYWDQALWTSNSDLELEQKIHNILFPNLPFEFGKLPTSDNTNKEGEVTDRSAFKWRNAWCDRQMIWSHIHHDRDVFVTRDKNFLRLLDSPDFAYLKIAEPDCAAGQIN